MIMKKSITLEITIVIEEIINVLKMKITMIKVQEKRIIRVNLIIKGNFLIMNTVIDILKTTLEVASLMIKRITIEIKKIGGYGVMKVPKIILRVNISIRETMLILKVRNIKKKSKRNVSKNCM